MEKIQSAIAKAREARIEDARRANPEASLPPSRPSNPLLANDPSGPAGAPAVGRPQAPPATEVEALWDAIPMLRTHAHHLAAQRILTAEGGEGLTEFDVIRTRLLQQLRAQGWRRVAVTSPGPHCGKTMVTVNLGFGLGQQRDQRTLVAEVDFRRPSMSSVLGASERHRFSKVLDGEAAFEQNTLRHGRNLIFASDCGGLRNPADLLQSEQAGSVLAEIEQTYRPTVMLFDLPPLLVNDDAMAFMRRVDCVLIVAAAETTTIKEIDACERALAAQTNVLGVVLNKCRYVQRGNSYGDYR